MTRPEKEALVRQLKELIDSRAWKHITAVMDAEIVQFVSKISAPSYGSTQRRADQEYNMGIIHGSNRFKQLPNLLVQQLELECLIDDNRSATADLTKDETK